MYKTRLFCADRPDASKSPATITLEILRMIHLDATNFENSHVRIRHGLSGLQARSSGPAGPIISPGIVELNPSAAVSGFRSTARGCAPSVRFAFWFRLRGGDVLVLVKTGAAVHGPTGTVGGWRAQSCALVPETGLINALLGCAIWGGRASAKTHCGPEGNSTRIGIFLQNSNLPAGKTWYTLGPICTRSRKCPCNPARVFPRVWKFVVPGMDSIPEKRKGKRNLRVLLVLPCLCCSTLKGGRRVEEDCLRPRSTRRRKPDPMMSPASRWLSTRIATVFKPTGERSCPINPYKT